MSSAMTDDGNNELKDTKRTGTADAAATVAMQSSSSKKRKRRMTLEDHRSASFLDIHTSKDKHIPSFLDIRISEYQNNNNNNEVSTAATTTCTTTTTSSSSNIGNNVNQNSNGSKKRRPAAAADSSSFSHHTTRTTTMTTTSSSTTTTDATTMDGCNTDAKHSGDGKIATACDAQRRSTQQGRRSNSKPAAVDVVGAVAALADMHPCSRRKNNKKKLCSVVGCPGGIAQRMGMCYQCYERFRSSSVTTTLLPPCTTTTTRLPCTTTTTTRLPCTTSTRLPCTTTTPTPAAFRPPIPTPTKPGAVSASTMATPQTADSDGVQAQEEGQDASSVGQQPQLGAVPQMQAKASDPTDVAANAESGDNSKRTITSINDARQGVTATSSLSKRRKQHDGSFLAATTSSSSKRRTQEGGLFLDATADKEAPKKEEAIHAASGVFTGSGSKMCPPDQSSPATSGSTASATRHRVISPGKPSILCNLQEQDRALKEENANLKQELDSFRTSLEAREKELLRARAHEWALKTENADVKQELDSFKISSKAREKELVQSKTETARAKALIKKKARERDCLRGSIKAAKEEHKLQVASLTQQLEMERTVKRDKLEQQLALVESIDKAYANASMDTTTVGDIIDSLETEYSMKFEKEVRKFVRRRIKELTILSHLSSVSSKRAAAARITEDGHRSK